MAETINQQVKTWGCSSCDYTWQFSGEAANVSPYDLTHWQLEQQFPEPQFVGLQPGKCPSCHARGVVGVLGLSIDPTKMSTVTISGDDEIEQGMVEELDEHGQPVMIQTGERYELRVNQQTGEVYSELVPVYEQKMRERTQDEIDALKARRNDDFRELVKIAV